MNVLAPPATRLADPASDIGSKLVEDPGASGVRDRTFAVVSGDGVVLPPARAALSGGLEQTRTLVPEVGNGARWDAIDNCGVQS